MTVEKMRIMAEKPLNAETPTERLRTWTTDNTVFFKRNQGHFDDSPVALSDWVLIVEGLVHTPLTLSYDDILRFPKEEIANTMECSGNSRSLLEDKASGNPWTVGGVGNAVWGGIWLKNVLSEAGLQDTAGHVAFEGFDEPMGSSEIKFIRSIPLQKAMGSTLLAYEMNGEPLPVEHGYPLRALALGWTGANSVKWLKKITVLAQPFQGFYMDNVYRVFQKGEDPRLGSYVKDINVKSVIVEPLKNETLPAGLVPVRGAAYAGEAGIQQVDVSVDNGATWHPARLIGINQEYAWRHWEYLMEISEPGSYTILSRATDKNGRQQPDSGQWNVLGYGNNGVREHAVAVTIGVTDRA